MAAVLQLVFIGGKPAADHLRVRRWICSRPLHRDVTDVIDPANCWFHRDTGHAVLPVSTVLTGYASCIQPIQQWCRERARAAEVALAAASTLLEACGQLCSAVLWYTAPGPYWRSGRYAFTSSRTVSPPGRAAPGEAHVRWPRGVSKPQLMARQRPVNSGFQCGRPSAIATGGRWSPVFVGARDNGKQGGDLSVY